jgi:hypothetical protein
MSTDSNDQILLWENEVLLEPAHLQQGHFVARMDRPWIGTPFPLEGGRVVPAAMPVGRCRPAAQCRAIQTDPTAFQAQVAEDAHSRVRR